MNNVQYTEKILSFADRILLDTSTLMSQGFPVFVKNNKGRLLAGGKKIIVPKAVYAEIGRHLLSDNPQKQSMAMAAVALNQDVFFVNSTTLNEGEIAHAFADVQILSELTLHKADCCQLLISNDHNLSCDAFDLNQQQSCRGRKILVCYINCLGQLQCCDCARIVEDRPQETIDTTNEADQTSTVSAFPSNTSEDESTEAHRTKENPWQLDWKSAATGFAGFGALVVLYIAGKALVRNIRM